MSPRSAAAQQGLPQTHVTRRPWGFVAAVICGLSLLLFLLGLRLEGASAASFWGQSFGIAATVVMILAALLSLRKRAQSLFLRMGLGTTRAWMEIHLVSGVVFGALVLFHTGFSLPTGLFYWSLWTLSLYTVVSGVLGVLVQKLVPRLLSSGLTTEVVYERAGELVEDIRERSDELASKTSPTVATAYQRELRGVLERLRPRWIYFFDIGGGKRRYERMFTHLRSRLGADEHQTRQTLDELERLFVAKLEIDAGVTLQRALRWWVWAHVPPSMLLCGFVVAHIVTVSSV